MNPDATGSKALRHAALHLHSLCPPDREWLLAQLEPARRKRLEVLLAELRTLGIPADIARPEQPAAPTTQDEAPPRAGAADLRLQQMSASDLDWLAVQLQEEPPQLAALVLAGRDWTWRGPLLERIGAGRASCIALLAASPAAPLAQASVLEALARMLPVPASDGSSSQMTSWWRRWR